MLEGLPFQITFVPVQIKQSEAGALIPWESCLGTVANDVPYLITI